MEEYRKFAPLIQTGLYYRLSDPAREEYAAWAFVSEDQKEVLLNVVLQEIHGNMTVNYVKLQGLKCSAIYRDTETGKYIMVQHLWKQEFRCLWKWENSRHTRCIWQQKSRV